MTIHQPTSWLLATILLAATLSEPTRAEPIGGGNLKTLMPRPGEVQLPPKPPPGYIQPSPPPPPYQKYVDEFQKFPVKPQINPPGLTYKKEFSTGNIGQ